MTNERIKRKKAELTAEYEKLLPSLSDLFSRAAIDDAVYYLHTQPSTQGKMILNDEQVSPHVMLNICFMHAALFSPAHVQKRAFDDFTDECRRQNFAINEEAVRSTVQDAANRLWRLNPPRWGRKHIDGGGNSALAHDPH